MLGVGGRSGSRRGGLGGPHFGTSRGQRIRVAPATSATAQVGTKVFAEAVQLVTWCTVISGVPGLPEPWLWAWASPTMMASAAAGRATKRGDRGDIGRSSAGRARVGSRIATPCFRMMSSNVSGLFRREYLNVAVDLLQEFARTVLASLRRHQRLHPGRAGGSAGPDRRSHGLRRGRS